MQTPLQSFNDLSLHGTGSAGAGASSGSSDYDFAEAERLRKQRDLKRKSRERKKVQYKRPIRPLQVRAWMCPLAVITSCSFSVRD